MKRKELIWCILFIFLSIHGFAQCQCDAPQNLKATLHDPSWNHVALHWDYPSCINATPGVLTHANGTGFAAGVDNCGNDPCEIETVQRFTSSDLAPYHGMILRSITFYPLYINADHSLRVWKGGSFSNGNFSAGNLIVDEPVSSLIGNNMLNTIDLCTLVVIDSTQELWIGYKTTRANENKAAATYGPVVPDKGNIVRYGNDAWTVTEEDYNWIIMGNMEPYSPELLGFNVYRTSDAGSVLLTAQPVMGGTFLDSLEEHGNYTYEVKAAWNTCESEVVSLPVSMVADFCTHGITALPYHENFDSYVVTGSSNFPDCWSKIPAGTTAPNLSVTQQTSLLNSLQFNVYSTSNPIYNVAIMPRVDQDIPIDQLQITFKAYMSNLAQELEVGTMTDSTREETFKPFGIAKVSKTSTWQEFTLYFDDWTEEDGRFIAFRGKLKNGVTSISICLDDIELDRKKDCRPSPENLRIADISFNSATVRWDSPEAETPGEYIVEVSGDGGNNWVTYRIPETMLILSGLTENRNYRVRVAVSCEGEAGNFEYVSFTTTCPLITGDTIGENNTVPTYLPFRSGNRFTYSQQIYLASELSGASEISGIGFFYTYGEPLTAYKGVTVYLAHTNKSSFLNGNDWVTNNIVKVFEGAMPCQPGWNEFYFTTPFSYNGTDNLVLIVENHSVQYHSTSYTFAGTATPDRYPAMYYGVNMYTPVDPLNPPGGTRAQYRNDILFLSCETVACPAPNFIVTEIMENEAVLSIVPANGTRSWEVEYRSKYSDSWIPVDIFQDTIIYLDQLSGGILYEARVRTLCTGEPSTWKSVTFRTACAEFITIPYVEYFDDDASGSLPSCWTSFTTNDPLPYIRATQYSSFPSSLYLASEANNYSIAVLPPLDPYGDPVNTLKMSFRFYLADFGYELQVGIMRDPHDPSTFELLEILKGDPKIWIDHTVYLNEYTGEGNYLAFRCDQRYANAVSGGYVDNVVIETIADDECVMPKDLQVNSVSSNSAFIQWPHSEVNIPDYYILEVSESGSDSWSSYTTTENSMILELSEHTLYDLRLSVACAEEDSVYLYRKFKTLCVEGGDILVGNDNGTTINVNIAISNTSAYSRNQQIFLSNEIGDTATLKGIGFHYRDMLPMTKKNEVSIYLAHTQKFSFINNTDWDTVCNFQLVYQGPLNCTKGWNEFTFDSVFQYNGRNNLLLYIIDSTGVTETSDYNLFTYHEAPASNMVIYKNAANLSTLHNTSAATRMKNRSDVIFIKDCESSDKCLTPSLYIKQLTDNRIDLEWMPRGTGTSWELEFKHQDSLVWETVDIDYTSATIEGLAYNNSYEIRIKTICDYANESKWDTIVVTTTCPEYMEIPYFENFNNDGYGSTSLRPFPSCWTRNCDNGESPYLSNTYYSAPASLYAYTTATGYSIAVLPEINTAVNPINTLQVDMYLRKNGAAADLQVGIMTNPYDESTFHLIGTVSPSATSIWEQATVYFLDYTGEGTYIALKSDQRYLNQSNAIWIDDLTVSAVPECSLPGNLTVSYVGGNSALVSWEVGPLGVPVEYTVECAEAGTEQWFLTENTTQNHFILESLEEGKSYDVRVVTDCEEGRSYYAYTHFTTGCISENSTLIGSGITGTTEIPINNYYKYGYTQQLFLADELTEVSDINAVSFEYSGTSPSTNKNNVRIYLANTQKSGFISNYDWDTTTLTLVYEGDLNCSRGWNKFILDTPFTYDGTGNLLLTVFDTSAVALGNGYIFNVHTTTDYLSIYARGNNPIRMDALPVAASSMSGQRNNVTFFSPCISDITCASPNIIVSDYSDRTADITFIRIGENDVVSASIKSQWDTDWTPLVLNPDNTVSITDLSPYTTYTIQAVSQCSETTTSDPVAVTFTTRCGTIEITDLPFRENFDSYGTGVNSIIPCWTKYTNYETYPYMESSRSVSSPSSAIFNAQIRTSPVQYTYNIISLPEIGESIDIQDLELSFMIYGTSPYSTIEVGVMVDPIKDTSFRLIESFNPIPGTFRAYSVPFHSYSGPGKFIAVKCDAASVSKPNIFSIDDLYLDLVNQCPRPLNITVVDRDPDHVVIAWDGVEGAEAYELVIGEPGFDPDQATAIQVTDTFYQTTLQVNTAFEVYLRTLCYTGTPGDWSNPLPFSSGCYTITRADLPYTESFDTWGPGDSPLYPVPNCWTRYFSNSNYDYHSHLTIVDHNYYSPGSSVYFYGPENATLILSMPEIDESLSVNDLQVSFKIMSNYIANNTPATFIVGVMTDPLVQSSFTEVGRAVVNDVFTWKDVTMKLDLYQAGGKYIAFKVPPGQYSVGTNIAHFIYLDDLVLDTIPSCMVPGNLTASDITATTARLNWAETGTAGEWQIEYGVRGFTVGGGSGIRRTTTSKPILVYDLAPATPYDFYVRSICSPGDTSAWSMAGYFNSECIEDRRVALPYFENFAGYEGGTYNTPGDVPYCWYVLGDNYSLYPPHVVSGGSYSQISSAPNAFMMSARNFQKSYAVLPEMNSPINILKMEFDYAMYPSDGGTLKVGYISGDQDNTAGFQELVTITPSRTIARASIDFSELNVHDTARYIAFEWYGPGSTNNGNNVCLDDIAIEQTEELEPCDEPVNMEAVSVTSMGATITWDAGGTEQEWEFGYRLKGTYEYETEILNVTRSELSELVADTVYEVKLRAICDIYRESEEVFFTFRTPPFTGHYILATADAGATITPSGNIPVEHRGSQEFTFGALEGYEIRSIMINGEDRGRDLDAYTFHNVQADSTITILAQTIGITEQDNDRTISVFPNPTNSILHVSTSVIYETIEILNMVGQVIHANTVHDDHFVIDVAGYSNGIYFIRLTNKEGYAVKKFVKE